MKNKKERIGVVVSNKMDKTITVSVERHVPHRFYKKVMTRASKFKAHDEKKAAKIGDLVRIVEVRPISKTKRWKLAEIIKK